MKITLKDVAHATGLSVTTVSRALNGFDDVAIGTREHIMATASRLGYAPNLNARRLKTQRADTVGLIVPNEDLRFSDPFFADLLSGIIDQIAEYGLDLNITTPTDPDAFLDLYLNYMRSRRVDGFILVRTVENDPRISLLAEHNFPFVSFGRPPHTADFSFVDEDGTSGIRQVIDHLVSLGHRRIACLTEPSALAKSRNRVLGYVDGLRRNGLDVDESLIVEGRFRQRSGQESAEFLLNRDDPPTAIVAVNDLLAIGAIRAVQERGLTVGRDISITGFDGITLSEYVTPTLTTLHMPAQQMGKQLCQNLISVINSNGKSLPQTIVQPNLIVRNSTGRVQ